MHDTLPSQKCFAIDGFWGSVVKAPELHPCFSFTCSELDSGTLGENEIQDGSEIRLVPAVESGVTVSLNSHQEES